MRGAAECEVQRAALFGLTREQYARAIYAELGKGYQHACLLYSEWFRKGTLAGNHPAFANASKLRQKILELSHVSLPIPSLEKQEGKTVKFLLSTPDRLEIESVIIPMQFGWTLCVSSQVGCAMGCAFCETGKMGLLRQLEPDEIVMQAFVARHLFGKRLRNVVFMGMGEPLDNFDAVMQAIRVLCEPGGFGLPPRSITVSTSGRVDGIERLVAEGVKGVKLAVSVNAPSDLVRRRLMPINGHYPMSALRAAMERYCKRTGQLIFIEYVLIRGINDSDGDAGELARYLRGLPVRINLIPYNSQSRDLFAPPPMERVDAFARALRDEGYRVLLRKPKGQAIMGACGQLGNRALRGARVRSTRRGCYDAQE